MSEEIKTEKECYANSPVREHYHYDVMDPKKLSWCKYTQDLWERLKAFAAANEHGDKLHLSGHPIFIWKKGDNWICYIQVVLQPTFFPAFPLNKELCPAGALKEIVEAMTYWAMIQHGACFWTRPKNSPTFTDSVMKKLRATDMQMELFEVHN